MPAIASFPDRFVFIDEPVLKINFMRQLGRAKRGERLTVDGQFGSWTAGASCAAWSDAGPMCDRHGTQKRQALSTLGLYTGDDEKVSEVSFCWLGQGQLVQRQIKNR